MLRRCPLASALILALAIGASVTSPAAAQTFDPAYRFRTLPTEHFLIYFHQGENHLATRLAVVAEQTWRALQQPLGHTPPRMTHVVLVDQTELSNGYATPLPRDTIVIYAVWPAGTDVLKTDDWLRLAFTHEFTHIVHLDRSEGWARLARDVFGRIPFAFPNVFLPTWQIEGLAEYEESQITGEGRLHAGDFQAIVGEAARANTLEPLDRVNGGLTDWPGGEAAYAYGLGFHAYLADHYGADKIAALADATARSLPYFASRAFERVYGKPLGALWGEYERSLTTSSGATRVPDNAQRLTHQITHGGFVVAGPRFAPPACASCPPEIWYSANDPNQLPALYRLTLNGAAPDRVVTRYLGSTTGPGRRTIYFDQLEVHRNTGVYSDLYALDRQSGAVRRITTDARLADMDLSPDEQTVVAVKNRPGQRDLVLVRLGAGAVLSERHDITTLLSESETQFNAPRWSPDGRSIAVERQRPGQPREIVVVDIATRAVRVVASDAGTRWVTPAWRPDGLAIIAAADLNDGPFNLYEIDLATKRARPLTQTTGGATWPDVSADGKTMVYVGYTIAGFDLFQLPYPAANAGTDTSRDEPSAGGHVSTAASDSPISVTSSIGSPALVHAYTPWATIAPTSWSPVVETSQQQVLAGAVIAGGDVLGYHAYAASATWRVVSPAGAPAIGNNTPDWSATYAYSRWRPIAWATASRQTSFFGGPPTDAGVPSTSALRQRQVEVGVTVPVNHVRVAEGALASVVEGVDDYTFTDGDVSLRRAAARTAAWFVTAHQVGYAVSLERGVAMSATAEFVRRGLGSVADATTITGDARVYLPGLAAHHVLAIRASGGDTTGDPSVGRVFLLGGAESNLSLTDFGSSAMSLLRGFPANTFAGTHVALVNADYRFPIARPQRGLGTWPLFVHTLHAAVFADAGHTWTTAFAARDLKTSVGAELSVDIVAGYGYPFTTTFGVAQGREGSHTVPNGTTWYVRVGHAF